MSTCLPLWNPSLWWSQQTQRYVFDPELSPCPRPPTLVVKLLQLNCSRCPLVRRSLEHALQVSEASSPPPLSPLKPLKMPTSSVTSPRSAVIQSHVALWFFDPSPERARWCRFHARLLLGGLPAPSNYRQTRGMMHACMPRSSHAQGDKWTRTRLTCAQQLEENLLVFISWFPYGDGRRRQDESSSSPCEYLLFSLKSPQKQHCQ